MVCAVDCGLVVNPNIVAMQVESSIGLGLGAVIAGAFTLKDGKVEDVRTGFGGMAATPKRAANAEAALRRGDFEGAAEAIKRDFQPIDDWRGTASYRVTVAANLIRRLKLRIDGTPSIDLESL